MLPILTVVDMVQPYTSISTASLHTRSMQHAALSVAAATQYKTELTLALHTLLT